MSISVTVDTKDVSRVRRRWWELRGKAPFTAADMSNLGAAMLLDNVREAASGRPGPQVITGEYRASIMIEQQAAPGATATAVVGTNAPQAARLEYGFVGIDSLGRHYHQPPFPHWLPATIKTYAQLHEIQWGFWESMK